MKDGGMRVRVHRGSHEIGGSCVEVAAGDGTRVLLDLGRPLSAASDDQVLLPDVAGLEVPDPTLAGIVISHPHLDHYGLALGLPSDVPLYMGEEAARLLAAAAFFSPVSGQLAPAGFLRHREPFQLGSIRVTPFLIDHSGFDAYSLLVECDGQRLFYTGDLRAHGRKAALFEQLLREPPRKVDALLMEGTHVRADAAHDEVVFETESDLEMRFAELCEATRGAVVVFGSAQNLDRLVTLYRAAKRSGRTLVVDLYGATVAQATRSTIPQPGFDALRVYVPQRQRVRVKESGEFWRVKAVAEHRVYPEDLAADRSRWLLHVPSSTAEELMKHEVLDVDGQAVWSMWDGYLATPAGTRLRETLAQRGIPLQHLHTSGHASVADLRRLVDAINPKRVVPIHSEAGTRFASLFPGVEVHADGEWWKV